jgi:hypothetical protein
VPTDTSAREGQKITKGSATVFVGNGRRYLTLEAACAAEARRTIREWCSIQGEDYGSLDSDWYHTRVRRLAGLYKARFRRLTERNNEHG